MHEKRTTLLTLFIPIFLETLLLMVAGIVDTLMLSSVPNGVGAVGTANTYIGMFFILLTVISSGMMAVMTQNIGAGKPGIAHQTRQVALVCNAIVGLVVALVLIFLAKPVLILLQTAPGLLDLATKYMRIVALGSFFDALTMIFCAYMRAFGHSRLPFLSTVSGNILNIVLNAIFLYALGWGVTGVATATVIGKGLSLILAFVISQYSVKGKQHKERANVKKILEQMIKIGFPAAIESISYSVAMTVAMGFVNKMDPDGFNATAKSYVTQVTNFSYCAAFALAQANCFFVGWRMGAKEYGKCYKGTIRVALIGIAIGIGLQLIFALLGKYIVGAFTSDEALIRVIVCCLFIDIALEIGRAGNLVFGQALKTAGYSLKPSLFSALINVTIAILGTWVFGLVLQWNVMGCIFALTLDECARATFLFFVWRGKKWERTKVVMDEEHLPASTGGSSF